MQPKKHGRELTVKRIFGTILPSASREDPAAPPAKIGRT